MRKLLLAIAFLACAAFSSAAQEAVRAWEGTLELPTYLLDPAEKAPIFDRDWSYQRARRSVYPYPLNDNMTRNRQVQKYTALYLENQYVQLCVLPEIGGRLFYAIDKTNGYDIFYHQDVIKPANVGMTGAWVSGGVEWNVFHHHRQTSHIPCDYTIESNADGSKTIWVGETEYRHRMQWAIGMTLHPDKSYIEIEGRLINDTHNNNSMLYWANVSTRVDSTYQIIFPQSVEFVQFHCKNWMAHWPVTQEPYNETEEYKNGIDAQWWAAHPVGNSMFVYDLQEDYIAGYDHGQDAGTMLAGNHNIIKGGKFWSWGPNSKWDTKILTDNAGHYIELMSGAYSDNQPDYNWSVPYETKKFSQYWYGIRNIGGVKAGDHRAALNMDIQKDGKVKLGVNTTEKRNGLKIELSNAGKVVFSETAYIAPDKPFVRTVNPGEIAADTDLTMKLYDEKGKMMFEYTPVHHDPAAPLPEIVDRPLRPHQIENTEECFLVGLRNLQFFNPFVDPTDYFNEVLRRDPDDTRANTQMGVYYRMRGEYDKAADYLRRAIRRQTKDYTRPKDAEALYNLGLILKHQGKFEPALDTLYRAVWNYTYNSAANFQLAQMYNGVDDTIMAVDRLDEALIYNGNNYPALGLKASILRNQGKKAEAKACLDRILKDNPLDPYATYEMDLLNGTKKHVALLRDLPESYIELALNYLHNGYECEAVKILKEIDAKVPYPTVKMWLGYFADKAGDKAAAQKLFDVALEMPIEYCNPFRLETIDVLKLAKTYCPDSFKPYYYMGNLLYEKQLDNAVKEWEKVIEMEPSFALAWRNIGWANWLHYKDYEKAKTHYLKAVELDPSSALFLEECDQVLEVMGEDVQFRYDLLKKHHDTCVKRYYPLAGEVITGMFVGDYDRVLDLLKNCYFPTREGVANFHDIYVDVLILAGADLVKKGDVEAALALYDQAFEYPENHQVFLVDGRSPHDAQVYCAIAEAYEKLGDDAKTKENWEKAAQVNVNKTNYRYWKGLALKKLGKKAEARKLFKELVAAGKAGIVEDYVNFYGAEGTTGSTVESINTKAYYTMGLGYKGLGRNFKAKRCFRESVELKKDNLWPNVMLRK